MVKMIKLGPRDCIMTREHCVPVDVILRVAFNEVGKDGCTIYLPSDTIGVDKEEGEQLQKLLSRM